MSSKVPPELIEAYKRADYRVFRGDGSFVFRIGVRSRELAALLDDTGHAEAVFLTAWSPYSKILDSETNAEAQAALKAELLATGCLLLDAVGEDPAGKRAAEPSFLGLGLSLETGRALGRKYLQNAVVWAGPAAAPELILLR